MPQKVINAYSKAEVVVMVREHADEITCCKECSDQVRVGILHSDCEKCREILIEDGKPLGAEHHG